MINVNDKVIYIDEKSVEHNALVAAVNGLNEGVIDVFYFKPSGEGRTVYGVYHIDHESKRESNPELPSYPLNAYKFEGEENKNLPSDHPVHDHPFAPKEFDSDGLVIPKPRPEYEAQIAAHQDVSGLVEGFQS